MKISIVIPCHNEKDNLRFLFNDLIKLRKRNKWDCEIVAVNDNSTDNTGRIIDFYSKKYKKIVAVHRRDGKRGMGFTLVEGTKKASGDVVVWMMGDRSDDLNTVLNIIQKLSNGYDMVFGSRYMKSGSRGDLGMDKAIFGSGYTFITKLLFGIHVHDITNAFRGFKKHVFDSIRLDSADYAISPEFAIKAQLKKYKLCEVPTTYFNRRAGKTKFKLLKMGLRYISLFKYRFKS